MPGYNNGNQGGQNGAVRMDTNTSSYDLYSNNTRLIVSLFNTNISLGIVASTKDGDGRLRYPTANAVRVMLTPERIQAISTSIVEEFVPAIKRGEPLSRTFVLNGNMTSAVQLELDGNGNITIYFCNEIKEDRIPKTVVSYTFSNTPSLESYDRTTGEYTQGPSYPTQFYLFARTLEDFTYGISHVGAHMGVLRNNSFQRRLMDTLYEIGAKMGLNLRPTSNGGQATYRYGGSGGANFDMSSSNSNHAPVEQNITSLDAMGGSDLPF